MRHVRALFESRPFLSRIPDQALIAPDSGGAAAGAVDPALDHAGATRDRDGGYAFVYLSAGSPVTVDLERLSGDTIRAQWYDPREGTATPAGECLRAGTRRFAPPTGGPGQDWVLVLDDAARGYPAVGAGA